MLQSKNQNGRRSEGYIKDKTIILERIVVVVFYYFNLHVLFDKSNNHVIL